MDCTQYDQIKNVETFLLIPHITLLSAWISLIITIGMRMHHLNMTLVFFSTVTVLLIVAFSFGAYATHVRKRENIMDFDWEFQITKRSGRQERKAFENIDDGFAAMKDLAMEDLGTEDLAFVI